MKKNNFFKFIFIFTLFTAVSSIAAPVTPEWRENIRLNCEKTSRYINNGQSAMSSWIKYNAPTIEAKREAFYGDISSKAVNNILHSKDQNWSPMPAHFKELMNAFNKRYLSSDQSWTNYVKENKTKLCLGYNLKVKYFFNCEKALDSVIEFLNFQQIYSQNVGKVVDLLFNPKIVQEIFNDESYFNPTIGAAKSMLQLMKGLENKKIRHQSHQTLYSTLLTNFIQRGFSLDDAEDRTWKILALYGSRGSAFDFVIPLGFVDQEFNGQQYQSLFTLFSGTTYLDGLIGDGSGNTGGINYTLPETILGSCHSGKPYHFWMSASMAHHLLKEGFSARTAFHTVYMLGMAHELGSTSYGRDPSKIFTTSIHSEYNSAIRIQLVMKALGALYAINPNQYYDMDLMIHLMESNAYPEYFKMGDPNEICKNEKYNQLCIIKYYKNFFEAYQKRIQPTAFFETMGVP